MRPSGSAVSPHDLGAAHEARLDPDVRRRHGVFYTPSGAADRIVELAFDGLVDGPARVLDPAVGGGSFLLAAARRLEAAGVGVGRIVEQCLFGVDRDPDAVAVTRDALRLWAAQRGVSADPGRHVVTGDVVRDGLPWSEPFDLVVGNPPFLGQLSDRTVRSEKEQRAVGERFGDLVGAYTDSAVVFLLTALASCGPGGRVALILPESFLSARDAEPSRRRIGETAAVVGLWLADERLFEAGVRVCVPLIEVGGPAPSAIRRWTGPDAHDAEPAPAVPSPSSWSPLVADLLGVPCVELATSGTLADLCTATAGFRDQYYGLRGFVVDGAEAMADDSGTTPRVVTSGAIDPFTCWWGTRAVRYDKRSWQWPRIDLERLAQADPRLGAWARDRLVPKIVVATQTRVLEVAADPDGCWYPLTPTISLQPVETSDLWRVLAVVAAPPVSAWAFAEAAGGALARDAVKLSARRSLSIPLPAHHGAWSEAADLAEVLSRRIDPASPPDPVRLTRFGRLMGAAYGLDGDDAETVTTWWQQRLPRPSASRRSAVA